MNYDLEEMEEKHNKCLNEINKVPRKSHKNFKDVGKLMIIIIFDDTKIKILKFKWLQLNANPQPLSS